MVIPPNGDIAPINTKLKNKVAKNCRIKYSARKYQEELFKQCLKQNVIIYLGTGLGKTFISVLYLSYPDIDGLIQSGRKAIFIAPTQDLVKQQATYINEQVPYRVKIFCGRTAHCGEHIDNWNALVWKEELKTVDVLFMTPQILVNATSSALISWTQFSVIFFDECHHAAKSKPSSNSPYSQLLSHYRNFYSLRPDVRQYPRPRLIGLTASLINSMPKNRASIETQVRTLERDFEAKCITDIKVQEEKPRMVIHSYSPVNASALGDALSLLLQESISLMEKTLKLKEEVKAREMGIKCSAEQKKLLSFLNRLKLASSGFSIKPSSFPKVMRGLLDLHNRCGIWALRAVCQKLIEAVKLHGVNTNVQYHVRPVYNTFAEILAKIYSALDRFLSVDSKFEDTFVRPQPKALLDILESEYQRSRDKSSESFSCVIFVTSRLEVVALNLWLQHISRSRERYSFIKADYAIGLAATMSSKYACITKRKPTDQAKMLNNFREGNLNVIVTTSVLEEGIDLPRCSTVIRYNMPKNFREYVQSRGRARQRISSLYMMCVSVDKMKTEMDINKYNDFEHTVKDLMREPERKILNNQQSSLAGLSQDEREARKDDVFIANNNLIQMSSPMCKIILHMYCSRLAKGVPFAGTIQFERKTTADGKHQTMIYLPSGCPIQGPVVGNLKIDTKLADNSAAVAAVKRLFELGQLNDHAVPVSASESTIDETLAKADLKPKYEPLDPKLEGEPDADKTSNYFQPKLFNLSKNLMIDCTNRHYKLVTIKLTPSETESRKETREFFNKPSFSIIVDRNLNLNSLPEVLFSHYGKLHVEYKVINENFQIQRAQDHHPYIHYMMRLFKDCMSIDRIMPKFMQTCACYLVRLDASNQPDFSQMSEAFHRSSSQGLTPGQVAKMNRYYVNPRNRNDRDRPLLVRAIRRDLNLHSMIPGTRRTFLDDVREKYGPNIIRPSDMNQRIIEVMPLSSALSETMYQKASKKTMYSTQSLFYPEQCLDLFEKDASSVFQAFSLPAIIHAIYLSSLASELEQEFSRNLKQSTDAATQDSLANESAQDIAPSLEFLEDCKMAQESDGDSDVDMLDEAQSNESGGEISDEEQDDVSSGQSNHGDEDELDSSEQDLLNKDEESDYGKMVARQDFNLNSEDRDELKYWNLAEYQEPNLVKLHFEHRESVDNDPFVYLLSEQYRQSFSNLRSEVIGLVEVLLRYLQEFEFRATSDEWNLNEDDEMNKRPAQVDTSIKTNTMFDSYNTPLIRQNRSDVGLLEALTLKSAQQKYDLECLENLGDSYLKYISSVVLFRLLEDQEGILTSARSRLVSNTHFTYLAKRKGLGSYAVRNAFSKDLFALMIGQEPRNPQDLKSCCTRLRPKQLADIFEAIVGYYLAHHGHFKALKAIDWLGLNIVRDDVFITLGESHTVMSPIQTGYSDDLTDDLKLHANSCAKKLSRFEKIIGYQFNDKSHIIQAFTHPSYVSKCTKSYERLEYLGDSLLDYMVTVTLLNSDIDKSPGQISSSRSALVNNYVFAKLALKYKFDLFILYFNHELFDNLARVRESLVSDPDASFIEMVDYDVISKLLADVFESVAGAIYVDSGSSMDAVWSVYYSMMKDNIDQEVSNPTKNIVSLLFETFPGKDRIEFEAFEEKAGEDSIQTRVRCNISGYKIFDGIGTSKRQAKLRAVKQALENLPDPERKARLDKEYKDSIQAARPRPRPRFGPRNPSHNNNKNQRQGYENLNRNSRPVFRNQGHHRDRSRAGSSRSEGFSRRF